MCVELIGPEYKISFKPELPLEEQLYGCQEALIDCEPDCPKVVKFFNEIEQACRHGKSLGIRLKMLGSNLNLYNKTNELNKEIVGSDILHQVTLLYDKADRGLEEIANMCRKGSCE